MTRRPSGFSLIELVIVLTIIGTFSALAVPRFASASARFRADAAAKRVANDLSLAATEARAISQNVTISYNLPAARYELSGVQRLDKKAGNYAVDLAAEPYRASIVSANFGGTNAVTFNLYGVPSQSGTVVIKSGSVTKTITYTASSGKAVVQ